MEAGYYNKYNFIIPAAGKGKRLRPFTNHNPKSMVKVGKETIIEHQLRNIPYKYVKSLTIITGYQQEKLVSFIKELNLPFNVIFYSNELFCKTHCAYSLLKARKEIAEGFIYVNSDLLFTKKNLEALIALEHKDVVCVRNIDEYRTDLQQVCIDENDEIKEWKLITDYPNNGEVVGPVKLSEHAGKTILNYFEQLTFEEQTKLPCYTLFSLLLGEIDFNAIYLTEDKWCEIDTPDDLNKANRNNL